MELVGVGDLKRGRCIAAVAAAAIVAAGCAKVTSGIAPGSAGTVPGVLRIVGAGSLDSAVPELSSLQTSVDLAMLWGAWLFRVNDKGDLEPELATAVPTYENGGVSSDGLTITYHLRAGVRWHDGAPFSARDAVFTWRTIMNSRNNVVTREGYDQVAGMSAPDALTLVVRLKRPYAPAVATLFGPSLAPMCILPEHLLRGLADINHAEYNRKPVGTGPYVVERYDPSAGMVLVANPVYFRGRPGLREIHFLLVGDPETRAVMLRSHEADLYYDPPINQVPSLAKISGARLLHTIFNEFYYLTFNETHPPLDNVRARRALAMAVDRKSLVATLLHGEAELANGSQPPFSWARDPAAHAPAYDRVAAGRLLDQAGWPVGADGYRAKNGKRLSLVYVFSTGEGDGKRYGPIFQTEMQRIGIEVSLKGFPSSLYYASLQAGGIVASRKFDVAFEGWIGGVDPDDATLWTCDARPPGGFNHSFSCDPRIDEQERIAVSHYDRATRKVAYTKIQRLLNEDVPVVFLFWNPRDDVVRDGVGNYRPAPSVTEFWNSWEWTVR